MHDGLHGRGLRKETADLALSIEETHANLRQMVNGSEHIDGTPCMVAPEIELEAFRPKTFRPPDDGVRRGHMLPSVLFILRTAKKLVTTREIAARMPLERAVDALDQRMLVFTHRRYFGDSRSSESPLYLNWNDFSTKRPGMGDWYLRREPWRRRRSETIWLAIFTLLALPVPALALLFL